MLIITLPLFFRHLEHTLPKIIMTGNTPQMIALHFNDYWRVYLGLRSKCSQLYKDFFDFVVLAYIIITTRSVLDIKRGLVFYPAKDKLSYRIVG